MQPSPPCTPVRSRPQAVSALGFGVPARQPRGNVAVRRRAEHPLQTEITAHKELPRSGQNHPATRRTPSSTPYTWTRPARVFLGAPRWFPTPPPVLIDPKINPNRNPVRSAASSASGLPGKRSPSSPTTASTPCSTAGRRQRASPSRTARRSSCSRTSGSSARSSTSRSCSRCRGTSPSGTAGTPRPGPRSGRTPSRSSAPRTPAAACPSRTTATWSTPPNCAIARSPRG